MAVELLEELEGFFDPDDFGVPMVATIGGVDVPFSGIKTTAHSTEQPAGIGAVINALVPRVICRAAAVPGIQQHDRIELPGGQVVLVNDLQLKGDVLVIHYHEEF
jgi:hypothetical protein